MTLRVIDGEGTELSSPSPSWTDGPGQLPRAGRTARARAGWRGGPVTECEKAGPAARLLGPASRWVVWVRYQLLLLQPPLEPVQLRDMTPVVPSRVIENVLVDFEYAVTV